MKFKVFIFLLFFFVLFPKVSFAADFRVSGKIFDQKNNPIPNSTVVFTNSSGKTIGAVKSDFSGFYEISVPMGTYNILASGPIELKLPEATILSRSIQASSTINFTLNTPTSTVAQKTSAARMLTPVAIGLFILALVFLSGFIFWKKRKVLPQPSSSN
jgi:hypothetical protein